MWHDKLKSANITQPTMLLNMESKLALSFSTSLKRFPKLKTKNAKVLYIIQVTKKKYKGCFFFHIHIFNCLSWLMDDVVTLDTSHNWKRNTIIQHKCECLGQSVIFLEKFWNILENCEFRGFNVIKLEKKSLIVLWY
jgi:hypothetical protein